MESTERDRRGTLLAIGQRVCYNQSGTVAFGEIVDITKHTLYGRSRLTYHVANLEEREGRPGDYKPFKSKVTRPHNLMVLTPDMLA